MMQTKFSVRKRRGGFTLIELTVVLAVLALVTHLAVRELSRFGAERLESAAERQMAEIRAAASAFYRDMGRLVCATNGTLSELWRLPSDAERYAIRAIDFHGTNILVAAGWRGPYLRLAPGRNALRDPWGNALEYHAGDEWRRLTVSNDCAVAIAHYGNESLERDRRETSLLPEGGLAARLLVTITMESDVVRELRVGVFGARGGRAALLAEKTLSLAADSQLVFSELAPGAKTLAIIGGGVRVIRKTDLAGGDNEIQIDL